MSKLTKDMQSDPLTQARLRRICHAQGVGAGARRVERPETGLRPVTQEAWAVTATAVLEASLDALRQP